MKRRQSSVCGGCEDSQWRPPGLVVWTTVTIAVSAFGPGMAEMKGCSPWMRPSGCFGVEM